MTIRNVVVVVPINRGGGANTAMALAKQWSAHNIRVRVLFLSTDKSWHIPERVSDNFQVQISNLVPSSPAVGAFHAVREVLGAIRNEHVEAVVAIGDYSGIVAQYAVLLYRAFHRKSPCLLVREAQNIDLVDVLASAPPSLRRSILSQIARVAYSLGWISVAATERRREEIRENRKSRRMRYEVVANPISIEQTTMEQVVARTIRIKNFGSGKPLTLIYVGDLNRRKNVESLIRALSILPTRVKLTLVGDGEELDSLRRLANQMVCNRVTFVPFLRDVEPELRSSDVFVSPSLDESFGNAMAEAIMCGLPLVTTPSGPGVQEFANRYENVFVSEDVDPISLARTIWTAIHRDYCPTTLMADGVAARERHDVGSVAAKYLHILNS